MCIAICLCEKSHLKQASVVARATLPKELGCPQKIVARFFIAVVKTTAPLTSTNSWEKVFSILQVSKMEKDDQPWILLFYIPFLNICRISPAHAS